MLRHIILSSILLATSNSVAIADEITNFTAEQQKEIGLVVNRYLMDNPNVLLAVAQKLKTQRTEHHKKDLSQNNSESQIISENMKQLVKSGSPKAGNAKGNVYVIEFFDYRCGHCKQMTGVMKDIIAANKNVQVIYKNFAVLGPDSELAARFALAAQIQGKFSQMHDALMKSSSLDKQSMMAIGKDLGLDDTKLEQDLNSEAVNKEIENNETLAKKLNINGTPAFIVAAKSNDKKSFLIPGAVDKSTLQEYVNKSSN